MRSIAGIVWVIIWIILCHLEMQILLLPHEQGRGVDFHFNSNKQASKKMINIVLKANIYYLFVWYTIRPLNFSIL